MKSCKKCGIESGLWNGLKLMEWVQNKGKGCYIQCDVLMEPVCRLRGKNSLSGRSSEGLKFYPAC